MGFPGGSEVKASAWKAGDPGSIPVLGRSPGEGNGNPLQYSCLENSMDRGAWEATVHGIAKSQTQLSNFTHTLTHSLSFLLSFLLLTTVITPGSKLKTLILKNFINSSQRVRN